MTKSDSIQTLMPALLKAQTLIGGAKKGASNPYFKSKYADFGSVLEACKDILNDNGITILQPHGISEFGPYVETLLVHSSGEWVSSRTLVTVAKQNDPQALGSAITYARRYGLQSMLSMPAEDDDGESAMDRRSLRKDKQVENAVAQSPAKTSPDKKAPPLDRAEQAPVPQAAKSRDETNSLISSTSRVVIAKKVKTIPELQGLMKASYGTDKKEELTDAQAADFLEQLRSLI
jgi:hypothetical protein